MSTKRRDKLVEIMLLKIMLNDYSCCHKMNELNEIIFVDEDFNNLINCLMRLSKNLIILRKKNLSIIQFDNHDVVNSSLNELNLTFARLFYDVIKGFKSCEGLKI